MHSRQFIALAALCALFSALERPARSIAQEPANDADSRLVHAWQDTDDQPAPPQAGDATPSPFAPPTAPRRTPAPRRDATSPNAPPGTQSGPNEPRPTVPPPSQPQPRSRTQTIESRSPVFRLASVPNMFGDSLLPMGQIVASDNGYYMGQNFMASVPLAGGAPPPKIAENNKALPMDRVFFNYNYFHNAFDATPSSGLPDQFVQAPLNLYTMGFEKTLCDGLFSVDVRLPLADSFDYDDPFYTIAGGTVGNLGVTFKALLWSNESTVVGAGLGVGAPTGDDVGGGLLGNAFRIHNQATYVLPYVGFLSTGERCFAQGFVQSGIATNGNDVDLTNQQTGEQQFLGKLDQQNLLFVDVAVGYWLCLNPSRNWIQGIAPVVEFHYATTLQDADILTSNINGSLVQIGNVLNNVDYVNLTAGLHTQLTAMTTVRVAGVFPLIQQDRPFDSEVQVQVNRRF